MTKEELNVNYKNGILTLKGESKQDKVDESERYLCRELKKSSFVRSFKLDDSTLDISKIKSSYEFGELRISIPKKAKEKEKDIIDIVIE